MRTHRLILHIDSNGQFTFTLTDQIDHPIQSHDDSTTNPAHQQGIFEETLDLDLSNAVGGHDAANNQFVLPAGTFDVGVIDDTPIVLQGAHENVTVDENDIDTGLSHGTSPNDGNGDGSFTGSPGDNNPGPATVPEISPASCASAPTPLMRSTTARSPSRPTGQSLPLSKPWA